ncbi:MAG TPA: exo-alpha-sialidase, partial [Burkholderiaceae bacterium]|nr:exo-alpha-sialidase [Burkholderiaceae bacterium]
MKYGFLRFILLLAVAGFSIPANAQHTQHAKKAGLAVGAAFAPDGRLWLLGLDADSRLTLRLSSDDGRSWGRPRLLDTGGDRVAADGEARPKLAFGPNGLVVIAYTHPLAKPYTGEIRMLRSADG